MIVLGIILILIGAFAPVGQFRPWLIGGGIALIALDLFGGLDDEEIEALGAALVRTRN